MKELYRNIMNLYNRKGVSYWVKWKWGMKSQEANILTVNVEK